MRSLDWISSSIKTSKFGSLKPIPILASNSRVPYSAESFRACSKMPLSNIASIFRIVIDPVYPPPPIEELINMSRKLVLPENPLENNKFELIFDEVEEVK